MSTSETVFKILKTEKTDLVNVISNLCAIDIRPFSIIEGIGFRKFAEKLIAIGAKHGNVAADDILPSARTVSRYVYSEAEKKRGKLRKEFLKKKRFAVTTDLTNRQQCRTSRLQYTISMTNGNCVHASLQQDRWKRNTQVRLL